MLNTLEIERYVRATAARADLIVQWTHDECPSTDGKVMRLPRPHSKQTKDEVNQLRNSVRHEVGHQLYTDFGVAKRTKTVPGMEGGLLGCLWNLFEDVRVDTIGANEYAGDREIANATHRFNYERLYKQAADPKANKEATDTMVPLLHFINGVYRDVFDNAALVDGEGERLIASSPEASKVWDKLSKGDYASVLRNISAIKEPTKGTEATLELSKRVLKEVFDRDPEEERKQHEKGGGKSKDGEKSDGGTGEGEASEAKEGGSEGKDKAKLKSVPYHDYLTDPNDNKALVGHHVDYSTYKVGGHYTPATIDQYHVVDYTKEEARICNSHHKERIECDVNNASHGFANRVRTLLQIRAKDTFRYGLKRGKLNTSSLYRVTMTEARGFNERVFKQKQESNVLDCAASILIDQSGSMSGSKYHHAACAGVMLSDVIGNTLHIPTEIMGFTTHRNCAMYIHRTFNDRLVSKHTLTQRFATAGDDMSGNPDGDAIMFAFDRLMARKEKRKLLIVCSDGSPSGGGTGGDIVAYTKKVVQSIEKESPVDIVGIGIMDDNVAMFYKEHYVIKNSNELETALLKVIDGKLK